MLTLVRTQIFSALLALLWAVGIMTIIIEPPWLQQYRFVGLVILLVLGVPSLSITTVGLAILASLSLGLLAVLAPNQDLWAPVERGLIIGLIFTLFLPTLMLIRETMRASPEMDKARAAFMNLAMSERKTGLTIGGQLFGSVLTMGMFAITAPLVTSEPDIPKRTQIAQAAMRGLAMSIHWSPFTVGMGFALATQPNVSLAHAFGVGVILSVMGTVFATLAFNRAPLSTMITSLKAFGPILAPVMVGIFVVIITVSLTGLSNLQAIAVVMPLLCMLRLVVIRRDLPLKTLKSAYFRLSEVSNEMMLITAASTLGTVIISSGLANDIISALGFERLPIMAFYLFIIMIGIGSAAFGMHSLVGGNIAAAFMIPMASQVPAIVAVQLILYVWMCASMVSLSSISVVMGSKLYELNPLSMCYNRNLLFLLMYGTALALMATVYTAVV